MRRRSWGEMVGALVASSGWLACGDEGALAPLPGGAGGRAAFVGQRQRGHELCLGRDTPGITASPNVSREANFFPFAGGGRGRSHWTCCRASLAWSSSTLPIPLHHASRALRRREAPVSLEGRSGIGLAIVSDGQALACSCPYSCANDHDSRVVLIDVSDGRTPRQVANAGCGAR
jgi:hypothetical protein